MSEYECKHYPDHCWKITYSTGDIHYLCQKCSEKKHFANEEFIKSKIEYHRTTDEIIEDLKKKITRKQADIESLQEMITKLEKSK